MISCGTELTNLARCLSYLWYTWYMWYIDTYLKYACIHSSVCIEVGKRANGIVRHGAHELGALPLIYMIHVMYVIYLCIFKTYMYAYLYIYLHRQKCQWYRAARSSRTWRVAFAQLSTQTLPQWLLMVKATKLNLLLFRSVAMLLQCVVVCIRVLAPDRNPQKAVLLSFVCVQVWCSVLQSAAVCCSVLQCAAECCSVLQCVAVCCIVLQCVAVCCSVLQCVAVWIVCSPDQIASVICAAPCNILHHTITHCNTLITLQHSATHCTSLQHSATHSNTLQVQLPPSCVLHTATHCNWLQHTALHCNTLNYTTLHPTCSCIRHL